MLVEDVDISDVARECGVGMEARTGPGAGHGEALQRPWGALRVSTGPGQSRGMSSGPPTSHGRSRCLWPCRSLTCEGCAEQEGRNLLTTLPRQPVSCLRPKRGIEVPFFFAHETQPFLGKKSLHSILLISFFFFTEPDAFLS